MLGQLPQTYPHRRIKWLKIKGYHLDSLLGEKQQYPSILDCTLMLSSLLPLFRLKSEWEGSSFRTHYFIIPFKFEVSGE